MSLIRYPAVSGRSNSDGRNNGFAGVLLGSGQPFHHRSRTHFFAADYVDPLGLGVSKGGCHLSYKTYG